jgi:hypothetical protein
LVLTLIAEEAALTGQLLNFSQVSMVFNFFTSSVTVRINMLERLAMANTFKLVYFIFRIRKEFSCTIGVGGALILLTHVGKP